METKEKIQAYLRGVISKYTMIPEDNIRLESNFDEYGITSLIIMDITDQIEHDLNKELSKTIFFEYKNLKELSDYFFNAYKEAFAPDPGLAGQKDSNRGLIDGSIEFIKRNPDPDIELKGNDIAIIGMSGIFPGAEDIESLWRNLQSGVDSITEVNGGMLEDCRDKVYCTYGGFIQDADAFDPLFFNIMPKEARKMDPQIRLFLQETWHAVENAGYCMDDLKGSRTGVFAGVMWGQYQNYGVEQTKAGNAMALDSSYASVANRISYVFDFKGPSMAVDSMCSSSLTALHLACKSIRDHECDMAVVGGVNLNLHSQKYISICEGKFASQKGRCSSFGEDADGYVPGEGVISVFIKPLEKAVKDGDHIHGIIKSTYISHGGKSNGYTVPSVSAEKEVICEALREGNIAPETITYIEAHGTGTRLGDPIEIKAIEDAYDAGRKEKCPIGSLKSNIGHLEAAAGIAGIVKVLLQMKYKKIVPSLHSEKLNSYIPFKEIPFYVPQKLSEWNSRYEKRRAAVSSFGAGGSNAHVILEEYQEPVQSRGESAEYVFLLSAESKEQLYEYARAYEQRLDTIGDLYNMSVTMATGRKHFKYRLFFVFENREDLYSKLRAYLNHNDKALIQNECSEQGKLEAWQNMGLMEIGRCWSKGYQVDWVQVLGAQGCRKAELPVYPFKKEHLWYAKTGELFRYEAENGNDAFCIEIISDAIKKEHSVSGQPVLPGAVFLVLTEHLIQKRTGKKPGCIKMIEWLRMVPSGHKLRATFCDSLDETEITFLEVESGERVCRSIVSVNEHVEYQAGGKETLNVLYRMESEDIYSVFKERKLEYGPAFQSIASILVADNCLEAEISPGVFRGHGPDEQKTFLLDAALQSVLPFQENEICFPVRMEGVHFFGDLSKMQKIHSGLLSGQKQQYYCELSGKEGLLAGIDKMVFQKAVGLKKILNLYVPKWRESALEEQSSGEKPAVFVNGDEELRNCLSSFVPPEIIYGIKADEEAGMFKEVLAVTKEVLRLQKQVGILFYKKISHATDYKAVLSLEGFIKCLELENPLVKTGVVADVDENSFFPKLKILKNGCYGFLTVFYRGKAYQREYVPVQRLPLPGISKELLVEDGYCVIVGGGNLAGLLMEEFRRQVPDCRFAILKREIKGQVKEYPDCRILACDVRKPEEVSVAFETLRAEHPVRGVIFTAGALADSLLINKDEVSAEKVILTKIAGIRNVDEASGGDPLQFFVAFSSIAAVLGNAGQADYAYANAYLNHFMESRSEKVKKGERSGISKAICWPLVQGGGMYIGDKLEKRLETITGLSKLRPELFRNCFWQCMSVSESNVIVCYGDHCKYGRLLETPEKSEGKEGKYMTGQINVKQKEEIRNRVSSIIANEIGIETDSIRHDKNLLEYGIESIAMMDITDKLAEAFHVDIPMTFLYEEKNLNHVTDFIIKQMGETGQSSCEEELPKKSSCTKDVFQNIYVEQPEKTASDFTASSNDIAIIGLSGRYPDAANINELWKNLKLGKCAVTEIPQERWEIKNVYSDKKGIPGTYYNKWGSFLKDYRMFDADFFHISPDEAAAMDPQERLFLEEAWKCMEDAGYKPSDLAMEKTGVFAGAMWTLYQLYGYENYRNGNFRYANSSLSSIANRVSYQFSFHGPSMTLDTMCSSTLSALYLACQSIQLHECDYCLVGGVNLSLHPYKYLDLCDKEFLSSDGVCRSFGKGGDGYVPGEGVGVILIKRLDRAVSDKDHIYGIIKGIAVNHGGNTGGFTVPDSEAQADVIDRALKKAGISAGQVSYIETHGTGTALGDPIEISGLNKTYGKRGMHYAIGSVKSNLGHLEAAAGMAAVTKVLLQMKHRSLVPSLFSEELNPYIDWDHLKFQVQQKTEEWKTEDGYPRIAAVSSFGAGGSNAHLIIEEYRPEEGWDEYTEDQYAILISSKTEEGLRCWCGRFLVFLQENEEKCSIESIAYTLQVGRECFECKTAFIVSDIADLKAQVSGFLEQGGSHIHTADSQVENGLCEMLKTEEAGLFINELLRKRKYDFLIKLWFLDVPIDWTRLYGEKRPGKISLPTYVFQEREYWIQSGAQAADQKDEILDRVIKLLDIKDPQEFEEDDTLLDLGFSSIYALKLINSLNNDYGTGIKLQEIQYRPAERFKDFINRMEQIFRHSGKKRVSLEYWKPEPEGMLFPEPEELKFKVKTILLTGATGNLGSGILYYLLKDTKYNVICLIRAKNGKAAKEKLRKSLECYGQEGLSVMDDSGRLKLCVGDIEKEQLGLSSESYDMLVNQTDLVLHSAASTDLSGDYEHLSRINVGGTEEMIKLGLKTRNKYLVFLSSHMVIGDRWYRESDFYFDEHMLSAGQNFEDMGYQRSKYESEIAVRKAAGEGLNWIIIRMGNIMGRSSDGAFPLSRGTCLYYDIIRLMVQKGRAIDTDLLFDITPVDYACKSIIGLMERGRLFETYHVTNDRPITMNQLYQLVTKCGYKVEALDEKAYAECINQDDRTSIFEELSKYNPIYGKSVKSSSVVNNDYTSGLLKDMGIKCPAADEHLIRIYLQYCFNQGFMKPDKK